MGDEHPIEQPITIVCVSEGIEFEVGLAGVTRIEACDKSGMYSMIPYIRIWEGETAVAEFCQHNIVGIYFAEPEDPSHE